MSTITTQETELTSSISPVFISHGGGPSFFIPPSSEAKYNKMTMGSDIDLFYRNELRSLLPQNFRSILVISAHWEVRGRELSVTAKKKPSLLFDYGGFPSYTYELKYPVPHDEQLEDEVVRLLGEGGISVKRDEQRGLDHGVFVPLKVIYPEATIPIVQLSLNSNLDPEYHYNIGELLAPLRDQGVLILGSGQTTHSWDQSIESMTEYENWLTELVESVHISNEERKEAICAFKQTEAGRKSHPREEHFMPFFVALGAAHGAVGRKLNDGTVTEFMAMSNFVFDA